MKRTRTASLEAFLVQPIAFYRVFAELSGSVPAGVMLSQAIYWSDRTRDGSGWFYKTQEQWTKETFLTRTAQNTARKRLKHYGFMEEDRRGMPAKVYFRVNVDRLREALAQNRENPTERITGTQMARMR